MISGQKIRKIEIPSRNMPAIFRKRRRMNSTAREFPPPRATSPRVMGSTMPSVAVAQANTLARPITIRMTAEVSADSMSSSKTSRQVSDR